MKTEKPTERFHPAVLMCEGRPYMIRADGHVHVLEIRQRTNDAQLRARVQEAARKVGLSRNVIIRPDEDAPRIILPGEDRHG